VRAQIAEAQKVANGAGSEQDIAEAKIELEVGFFKCGSVIANTNLQIKVLESLQAALK
jgi:hypothetical protein